MAFTTELVNVSPRGDMSVALDGDRIVVEHGATVKVTPEQAGEPPRWRRGDDNDSAALRVNPRAVHWRIRAGVLEVFDLGSGMLAQDETWRVKGHEEDDPADPVADGHGGTIDGEQQAAALAELFRAADTADANTDSEENS